MTSEFEDGNSIQDEINSLLDDPVFIKALNVANYEEVSNDPTSEPNIEKKDAANNNDEPQAKLENPTATEAADTGKSSGESHLNNHQHRIIEKLRIVIPSMSSPSSIHSSSSECSSPVRSKKNKKRFCIKCDLRFKHTVDWLKHLEKHISLPSIKLTKLDTNDTFYKEYLERYNGASKRRLSNDTESLKIKLKIPRTEATTSNPISATEKSTDQPNAIKTPTPAPTPPTNECRLRVLKAEEIKLSPPRSPLKVNIPENAMVALPPENQVHYECPTLDGLNQFAEDAMNEESTANILKQLLATSNEVPEASEWDSTPNEFISIERLAYTCKVCDEKYPDLNYLHEHQRLTGHRDTNFSPSILEPIQEMTVDPLKQYHPPQTSQLEHMLQQKSTPPRMPMYGQPPVLPIHQMENQVRNFPAMNQMQNRQPFPVPAQMPNRQRFPAQMPPNYVGMHQFPPHPSQMVRPNHVQSNQPINMTPFLEMSPDMYNPRQSNNGMPMAAPNGMNAFNRAQIMNRYMQQRQQQPPPPLQQSSHPGQQQHSPLQRLPPQQMTMPNGQNVMQRFSMQPPPMNGSMNGPQRPSMNELHRQSMSGLQRPSMNGLQRPSMNGPPINRPSMNGGSQTNRPSMNGPQINRPLQNSPSCAPNIGRPPQMLQMQRQTVTVSPHEQQRKQSRFEQMMRAREIENRPIISNAPRTEGLPVIESVQSGGITLEASKPNKPIGTGTTIQINDQITLSVKNKDPSTVKLPEKLVTPPLADSKKVANILVNRGITIKPTTKLMEKAKAVDESNKTPYATAEAAVQKLQMNNSVSIVQKKKTVTETPPPNNDDNTIDLSNDDDASDTTSSTAFKKPTKTVMLESKPSILKCPMKTCNMRFSNVKSLRDHTQKSHQMARLNRFKCTICMARFASSEAVRTHIQRTHGGQSKAQPDLGIPIVNFNDPSTRKKMLSLGFTNFLPISNTREEKNALYGVPIININGPSVSNLKNLFSNNATKIMPISSMRTIPRPKAQTAPSASKSASTSTATATSLSLSQSPRTISKLPSISPNAKANSTEI